MTDPSLDPVCGMTVAPDGPHHCEHEGVTYRFCSPRCLARFREEPGRFLGGAASHAVEPPGSAPRRYTCPMHPEIVRDGPGTLPDLRHGARAEDAERRAPRTNAELRDMTRRFWVSAVLTLPLVVLAMADMLPGRPLEGLVPMRALAWIELALATPVVLWGGWPFFVRGWRVGAPTRTSTCSR